MEEENNRSSVAPGDTENKHLKAPSEGGLENRCSKVENEDEQKLGSSDICSDFAVGNSSTGELKASESKTLASVQLSQDGFLVDFVESSHLLSEVPVEYSLALRPLQSAENLKDQVQAVDNESSKGVTGASTEIQIQVPDGPFQLEVSPSGTQPISSILNQSLPQQKLRPVKNVNNICPTEQDKQNSADTKPLSIKPVPRTSDGYNWRKYGQKQVKSPEGSRSYYRCTFSDCYAKKIECCDPSNRPVETVYRSHHTHDPPQKVNYTKESTPALPIVPVSRNNYAIRPAKFSNDLVQANLSEQSLLVTDEIPETKKQESSDSDETTEMNMDEYVDGAECKKRQKRNSSGELKSPSKRGKKPKYVVHAAGDVGISGDGYRWRKYGQKMVKGNPHPRNYYRCTSAGCPVRKHIERAVDNTNAVVITYKGAHDHDTPVPRKRNGPKSTISDANPPVTLDDLQNKTKQSQKSQTQWLMDKEGELMSEPLNLVGEQTSDSARALLSIGFEIKPC
uniref:WRKY family protein 6 n=1 Tax=Cistanche tubulosa TaxID=161397 RepID=A0A6B9EMH4_9LAMI|nr:WRKY family protein 6 [Cistanche tubulosa]